MSEERKDLSPKPDRSRGGCGGGVLVALGVLITLGLAYLGIDLNELIGNAPIGLPPATRTGEVSRDWYQIYFTAADCPPLEERSGGVDNIIADDIRRAQRQIDMAAFDLDSQPIIDALINAERRGVNVRFVTDDEHNPPATTNRLRRNGISVIEDRRSALMHNKFIVIDSSIVWTGSLNFTTNGVYCNDNNVVRFDSPQLARNYMAELAEMVDSRSFGPTSPINTERQFTINGILVENYFAPETEVAPIIGRAVARADREIMIMAFAFTSEDIGEAVLERAQAGLNVRTLFETVGSDSRFSYAGDFRRAALPNLQVRTDGNRRIMHHKVIVIDREVVIFGSFNFSNSAIDSNDENLVIVHDADFARAYAQEFERLWAIGSP